MEDAAHAIRVMQVRGAPLIGATAAYGVALAHAGGPVRREPARGAARLAATRPTAVNLRWALEEMRGLLAPLPRGRARRGRLGRAGEICDEDVAINQSIGEHGLALIREIAGRKPAGASMC